MSQCLVNGGWRNPGPLYFNGVYLIADVLCGKVSTFSFSELHQLNTIEFFSAMHT